MRRARPGDVPRGPGGFPHARRAMGEERALTSVGAGADFDDGAESRESAKETDTHGEDRVQSKLWHITLSVSGAEAPLKEVRRGLEQLAHDHPFLLTSRYANDHAEIRYWEEARDLHDAAAVALRLWGEHRSSAQLPPWEIVGLEVIDRQTYHQRIAEGYGPPPAAPVGVHPF
ncbi:hypothetical protein [Streptomyces sp.]|uniref:hypothetical protein n=1 Tax=Streptomyces sp. TaxID=1931 RepID=UPI002D78F8E7|nr:hypothetical protein [Streptomyces sp.]HET6356130.1 hypothetical protein [Streptomyces sp.]